MFIGLIFGLIHGFKGNNKELDIKRKPNQGIQASIKNILFTWTWELIFMALLYLGSGMISEWLIQVDKRLFEFFKPFSTS